MLPAGIILLWSGSIGSIPAGYVLCDGNNGTPDLQDNFVVGAGSTYNPGITGGSTSHLHPFTADPHSHSIAAGAGISSGANFASQTSSVNVTGSTNAGPNLPPFYSLAYIMKT